MGSPGVPEKLQEFIWSLLTFWWVSRCWLGVSRVSRKLQQVGLGSQDALNTVKHSFPVSVAPGQLPGFGLGGFKGLVWGLHRFWKVSRAWFGGSQGVLGGLKGLMWGLNGLFQGLKRIWKISGNLFTDSKGSKEFLGVGSRSPKAGLGSQNVLENLKELFKVFRGHFGGRQWSPGGHQGFSNSPWVPPHL